MDGRLSAHDQFARTWKPKQGCHKDPTQQSGPSNRDRGFAEVFNGRKGDLIYRSRMLLYISFPESSPQRPCRNCSSITWGTGASPLIPAPVRTFRLAVAHFPCLLSLEGRIDATATLTAIEKTWREGSREEEKQLVTCEWLWLDFPKRRDVRRRN